MTPTRRELVRWAGGLGLLICTPLTRAASNKYALAPQNQNARLENIVVEGKFGKALNAAWSGAETSHACSAYKTFPLTVEFWCRLEPTPLTYNFIWTHNILVANEPRESADHWAIYLDTVASENESSANYGLLSAYLPGMTPETVRSSKVIADGRWHYVAMVIDGESVALYADGDEAIRTLVHKKSDRSVIQGKLTVGKANLAAGGTLDFNGAIDDLRLSRIAREIRGTPAAPLQVDEHTVGLWSFDSIIHSKHLPDASTIKNPLQLSSFESLDEIERSSYKASRAALDSHAEAVSLQLAAGEASPPSSSYFLDGKWQLVEGDTANWEKALTAVVPGSVHTALYEAGVIPFPYSERNQEIAAKWSERTYWLRKIFPRLLAGHNQTLVFRGICNRCTIWLNGQELRRHEGMFTRVHLSIDDVLQENNTLVVKLEPAVDWMKTLVPNIFYGPFYTHIPPLGIWRSVEIIGEPHVKLGNAFISTRDAKAGIMDLVVTLAGPRTNWAGMLVGTVSPDNFEGRPYSFEHRITAAIADKEVHLRLSIPEPQLWWPVDMGRPNLYRLTLSFRPSGVGSPDVKQLTFGIRTVQMAPVNGRPRPRWYNWTFVVNGKPMFVKGTNWCTPDAMMDFSRARYERLLTLAARQHIQMLRVWGYGMVETDDFYDLCDRLGLMVMQEWPTTWNSHTEQPLKLLEDTVRDNTLRLRNHPSLVIYGGGNESTLPFGAAIDMMGRLGIELDGTRPFHRGQPRGGSTNDYAEIEGGIDRAFTMEALFYGEVGFSYSYPNLESVRKLLPTSERNVWPAPSDGVFVYKTRVINSTSDWHQMVQSSELFTAGKTMERFIIGTQLAQSVGVRHILERARTRWPECTGALYFKFNEVAPTAERTVVDWFGAPKIPYYFIQCSLAPLLAVALFPKASSYGEPLALPVFLLDDAHALDGAAWQVTVRAFDAGLNVIKTNQFKGGGSSQTTTMLGIFTLTAEQTRTAPLLVVTDVTLDGALVRRNYYFTNFSPVQECLFDLPRTRVEMEAGNDRVTLRNTGKLPAVGVSISRPGHLDTFTPEESYLWLEPGEAKSVAVNTTDGLKVEGWNI